MNLHRMTAQLSSSIKIYLAIGIQFTILLFLLLIYSTTIATGTRVYLEIEPFDPTDPLRGDYITFQYTELSTIKVTNYSLRENIRFNQGDIVYVPLKQSNGRWIPSNSNDISKRKPVSGTFMKGTVTSSTRNAYQQTINISYGIEQYFIPERSGRTFNFGANFVMAEVYLNTNGEPVLKQVYINNQPWP